MCQMLTKHEKKCPFFTPDQIQVSRCQFVDAAARCSVNHNCVCHRYVTLLLCVK